VQLRLPPPLKGSAGLKMEHRSPAKIRDYTDLVKVLVLDDIAGIFHWVCLTLRFMRTEPTALQHLLEGSPLPSQDPCV